MKKLILFFCVLGYLPQVLAAACCGGAGALPSLITGDENSFLNTSLSQTDLHTRVSQNGVWRRQSTSDETRTLRLDYAHIFQDRFQFGASAPITQRTTNLSRQETSSGLGDVSLQLGYEYLPDWDYNLWRPKGIGYLVLSLPTGTSKYESVNLNETRGKGYATLGVGSVLTKQWSRLDTFLGAEVRRGFSRSFDSNAFTGKIVPQWGKTASLGAGYHFQDWRVGTMLSWVDEDAKQIVSENTPQEEVERFATGSLSLTYSSVQLWSVNFAYADQTLFGDPTNTTLSKTWSLSFQTRWAR